MKRKITQFLMLALALVWAIPRVSAVEYEFSAPTKVWSQSETTYSGIYRNIAVSGDDIFTLPAPPSTETTDCTDGMYGSYTCGLRFSSSKVVAFSGGSTSSAFPYGSGSYYFMGPAMASDSKGTIVAATIKGGSLAALSWSNRVAAICYYTSNPSSDDLKHTNPNGGSKSGFSISTDALRISGRTDRMTAYGDISTTGYLWFVPGTTQNTGFYGLERITVTNYGKGSLEKTQFSFPAEITKASGNTDRVLQYTDNNLLLDVSGQNYYKGTISGTNTVTWENLNIKVVSGGASMFVLQGHEILAYSSDETTITLVDITQNNNVIGTFSPFATQSSNSATRHAIDVRVSGNTANIYVLVPGQGAAKYTITATEVEEYTDPVQNLKSAIKYGLDSEGNVTQNAVLTWEAPATGASNVTGYIIYRGDTQIATVAKDVLTYTDAETLTAETIYKVIPSYDTNSVGTDATTTIAPRVFKAPKNLTVTPYDGYARAQIQWDRAETDPDGIRIRYELWRDGVCLADHLARVAYMDTKIPEGNHSYTVYSVYYADIDGDGEYEDEIARLSVGPASANIIDLDEQLVNYQIEVVYNHTMWDIWNNGIDNGVNWTDMSLGNFNPEAEEVNTSNNNLCYVDAEHYRQGALVTDANGKKWWYISQKTTSWTLSLDPSKDGPHGAGILKISAEDEDLKKGGAPVYYKGADLPIEIKNGQSVGIAADDEGNIFVRGHDGATGYGDYMNFTKPLSKGVIYTPDMTKAYEVDLSGVEFSPERPADYGSGDGQTKRVDYYRMSGKLFTNGYAYLYGAASHARTMTVVKLKYANDAVTVDEVYQYTPTALESGKEIALDTGSENYAFPIEDVSTGIGSLGYIYQRRGNGYFYVPTGATTNEEKSDVLTTTGKINNAGGTTVRMINEEGATQLFLIVPESFYSQNIGSFSVNLVTDNEFKTGIVPVANMNQTDVVPNGNITNVNGNWIFAEYDAEDKCIYIYQYVPGIRIAKYRLYGSISYYSVPPTLDIATAYHETEGDITNFKATATWKTPEDYTGTGDYVIRHYEVNLLDGQNKIIDTRLVDADTITATFIPGSDIIKEYKLTFDDLSDITDQTVATGGTSSNFFVDDDTKYTIEVTAIYNSKIAEDNDMIGGLRRSATQTAQAEHSYTPIDPVPTVDIYKGVSGTVTGLYRIEFGLETPLESDEKVSHYELYYTRKKLDWNTPDASTTSGFAETLVTERMTGFEAVTSSVARSVSFTEGQDVISGEVVRNGQSATYLSDSKNQSYAVFHYNSNLDEWTEYNNDPTTWTYTVKAVYADDNALLRKTTDATVATTDFTPTGVEEVVEGEGLLEVYPIPADTELTIKSSQAIEMVTILSTTGVEVKRVLGNGESQMTIDVEDIASGYYFLKVNNLPMKKIIVK